MRDKSCTLPISGSSSVARPHLPFKDLLKVSVTIIAETNL